MTKAFERFLRTFSDEDLAAFARDRAGIGPPYWQAMRLALRIEADRRGLRLEIESPQDATSVDAEAEVRLGTA